MENEELAQLIKEADDCYTRGRIEEALELYKDILDVDPTVAWAHSRIGAILAQRGELEAAEIGLMRALELNPDLPQAHSNLGNIHYSRGEYDKAVERYQIAAKLDPNNPLYLENQHAAFKRQRKYSEAIKSLKQSHKLSRAKATSDTKAEFQGMKRRIGCTGFFVLTALVVLGMVTVLAVI